MATASVPGSTSYQAVRGGSEARDRGPPEVAVEPVPRVLILLDEFVVPLDKLLVGQVCRVEGGRADLGTQFNQEAPPLVELREHLEGVQLVRQGLIPD